MARTGKIGIDYFSHDVNMRSDPKVRIIMAKHGTDGYAVYNMLLEGIYAENGYYLQLNEDYNILFSNDCKISFDAYILILNDCIEKGLFSRAHYEKYSVLTSARIQKNYIDATQRRKDVSFCKEFLIVDPLKMYPGKVNVNILKINDSINPIDSNIGTQIERKEKGDRKENEKEKPFDIFWRYYPKKKSKEAARKAWKKHEPNLDVCISAIDAQKNTNDWKKEGGSFIPYPATWINGGCWDDEIENDIGPAEPKDGMTDETRAFLAKVAEERSAKK